MICKFCGSSKVKPIKTVQSPYINYKYTLYQCNNCKCRFFDVKEHNVDIESIYEEHSVRYNKTLVDFKKRFYWTRQTQRIRKVLGKKPLSVLDIGCRTGDFLLHFPNSIIREGVELSKGSTEIAQSRGLTIHQGFIENITLNRRYSVVTCYAVLEHLVYPLVCLDKFSNIVSPGGILVIMIPTHECFKRWVIDRFTSIRWWMYSPPEHLNFFSRHFLDQYLTERNFILVSRYWTSGGMFNPLKNIPLIGRIFSKVMSLIDEYIFINRLPIFDHMYSYYVYRPNSSNR